MNKLLLTLSLFVLCLVKSGFAQTPQTFPPVNPVRNGHEIFRAQHAGCPTNNPGGDHISAIDVSAPVDDVMLAKTKEQGVRVIFRYYDWDNKDRPSHFHCIGPRTAFNKQFDQPWTPGEYILGKTLTPQERDKIFSYGFAIGVVFQHCSAGPTTFADAKRASFDADRALKLAEDLGQTKNTPIFFGVDYNAGVNDMKNVRRYFATISKRIMDAHFRIGVYGNGLTCDTLKGDHPDILCWISQSKSYSGSEQHVRDKKYDIKQCLNRQPWPGSKTDFDLNVFNGDNAIKFWEKPSN